jgi:hypothetical protein
LTRYATIKRDEAIMNLYWDGKTPKEIRRELNLTSTWIVYRAIAKKKSHGEHYRQIPPISPVVEDK